MRLILLVGMMMVFLSPRAYAQVSAKQLEMRAKLESGIAENLRSLIETQLARDAFTVAVSIQLKENKTGEKPPEKKPEVPDKILGLDLGVIDVQGLLESYERELAEARAKAQPKKDETKDPTYQIASIGVSVGLDEKFRRITEKISTVG